MASVSATGVLVAVSIDAWFRERLQAVIDAERSH
jgi:hypothetical protein